MGLDYLDLYLIHFPIALKASIFILFLKIQNGSMRVILCNTCCISCYFDSVGTARRLSAVTTVASGYNVYIIS